MRLITDAPGGNQGQPHFERLTQIILDHLFFAEHYPEKLAEISQRLKCTEQAALAVAISDQITEEFSLTEREDI